MSGKNVSEGYFRYVVEDGKVKISSYHGSTKILFIPKTVEGYAVTRIGWGAFLKCESLVIVVIPDSVTHIGNSAFYGCKKLAVIVIPDSVTDIGKLAFANCFALIDINMNGYHPVYIFLGGALFDKTKGILLAYFGIKGSPSYTIPNFVTSIAHKAFMDCPRLESVEIPDSVTTIENMAFYGCKRLKSVIFGNSVTSIGNGAFCNCKRLKEVRLPKSVTSIGERVFDKGVVIMGLDESYACNYAIDNGLRFREVESL